MAKYRLRPPMRYSGDDHHDIITEYSVPHAKNKRTCLIRWSEDGSDEVAIVDFPGHQHFVCPKNWIVV